MSHVQGRLVTLITCGFGGLFLHAASAQNCHLASVTPYGSSNPVTLTSRVPGEFMVPNTNTFLHAASTAPVSLLGLSPATAAVPLPPPHEGSILLDPTQWVLIPGGGPGAWSLFVPGWLPVDSLVYTQSLHVDLNPFVVSASNGLRFRVGFYEPEIEVTGIDIPDDLVGGIGPRTYRVHLRNNGPAPATSFRVQVNIGGNSNYTLATVSGHSTRAVDVAVATPPAAGPAGTRVPYTVTACASIVDCNGANNCRMETAYVAVPYWDLRLSLIGAPSQVSVGSGTNIRWTVRVRNAGNRTSGTGLQGFTVRTAVNCSQGVGNYTCMPTHYPPNGWLQVIGGGIPAGGSQDFPVTYTLPGNTWRRTQYIKADVIAGDAILSGNDVEQAIVIR